MAHLSERFFSHVDKGKFYDLIQSVTPHGFMLRDQNYKTQMVSEHDIYEALHKLFHANEE